MHDTEEHINRQRRKPPPPAPLPRAHPCDNAPRRQAGAKLRQTHKPGHAACPPRPRPCRPQPRVRGGHANLPSARRATAAAAHLHTWLYMLLNAQQCPRLCGGRRRRRSAQTPAQNCGVRAGGWGQTWCQGMQGHTAAAAAAMHRWCAIHPPPGRCRVQTPGGKTAKCCARTALAGGHARPACPRLVLHAAIPVRRRAVAEAAQADAGLVVAGGKRSSHPTHRVSLPLKPSALSVPATHLAMVLASCWAHRA